MDDHAEYRRVIEDPALTSSERRAALDAIRERVGSRAYDKLRMRYFEKR